MLYLRKFILFYFVLLAPVWAASRVKFKADRYSTNLDTKVTHAIGHVIVELEEKTLTADEVFFLGNEGLLDAVGHAVFTHKDLIIEAHRIKADLHTGLGEFFDFIMRMGETVYLEGHYLERYGLFKYRVKNGKVSRCLDCPHSWSVFGTEMNLEIEKYAQIENALIQIKDAPVIYLPYFFFPVKSKRESGFLISQYSQNSELGYQMRIPYFQVWNDFSDSTFEYHLMSKGGNRLSAEYRYKYSDLSYFESQVSGVKNGSALYVPDDRYGYSIKERSQLSPFWVQRFRGENVSDSRYTRQFPDNFQGALLPSLLNEVSISHQSENQYFYVLSQFTKDNIPRNIGIENPTVFSGSIHRVPELMYGLSSYHLVGPLMGEYHLQYTRFTRKRFGTDPDTGWIRTGQRSTQQNRLTAPMIIEDQLIWTPSVELRADEYKLDGVSPSNSSVYRLRTFFDQRLETEFYRIYALDGIEADSLHSLKHSVVPFLRWSYSPPDARSQSSFFTDTNAPRFDLFDPNSDAPAVNFASQSLSEEQRLKYHHLITYGVSTLLTARYGEENRRYEDFTGLRVDRDFDIIKGVLSRLRLSAFAQRWGFRLETTLAIDTGSGNTDATNRVAYTSSPAEIGVSQRVGGSAAQGTKTETYSVNSMLRVVQPWALGANVDYDAISKLWIHQGYNLVFNSLSKCWRFEVGFSKDAYQTGFDFSPTIKVLFTETNKNSNVL